MSKTQNIDKVVIEEIARALDVEPSKVTMTSWLGDDLKMDSLQTVELIMTLEEKFGVEIPDEEAKKMQTVGDVVKYIEDSVKTS